MITTTLQGRMGNNFYQIAMMLAYCKQHNLPYYIPDTAYHCDGRKMYFPHLITGPELTGLQEYHELPVHATPNPDGTHNYNTPAYRDIPAMDNIKFVGYWQSFKYFDWCRDYILEKFNLPYNKKEGVVAIHCRFGDFTQLRDKHPELPNEYYIAAVNYFIKQGYRTFYIYSDDVPAGEKYFNSVDWEIPITLKSFDRNVENVEMAGFIDSSECEHQILCYSTFGILTAWLNRNSNKQVVLPPIKYNFSGANADMIPDYFILLDF